MDREKTPRPILPPRLGGEGGKKSPPLHPLEIALLVAIMGQIVAVPWSTESMRAPSQIVGAGFAVVAFVLALIPRRYRADAGTPAAHRLIMWPKLVRFPIFWLGLALLAYIVTQALNPAWMYVSAGKYWWLVAIDHVIWLPSGMITPFVQMNPWRMLIIFGQAWLLVCALWVGLTRRKAVLLLLNLIAINGVILAAIGGLQKLTHSKAILWHFKPRVWYFVSTFQYKGHAGAYFYLTLAALLALTAWAYFRATRRLDRSSPAPLYACAALIPIWALLVSNSRGAVLMATLLIPSAILVILIGIVRHTGRLRGAGIALAFATVGLLVVVIGGRHVMPSQVVSRFEKLFDTDEIDYNVLSREVAHQATWEMARDNLVFGWGAGGFRFYFPEYQKSHPEIQYFPSDKKHKSRLFWEYAHNDYLQWLAEYGLVGAALAAGMLIFWFFALRRSGAFHQPWCWILLLGIGVTLIHETFDFMLSNPAIFNLWCLLWPVTCRWAETAAPPAPASRPEHR